MNKNRIKLNTHICSTDVCISDCNSSVTKLSSRVASKIAASSATRGWNNWDLLLRVDGKGVGSGNTGNTVKTMKLFQFNHEDKIT